MFEVDYFTLFRPFDFYLVFDLDFTLLCDTAGTLLFIVSPLEEFLIFFLDFRGSIDFFWALFNVIFVIVFSLADSMLYLPNEV